VVSTSNPTAAFSAFQTGPLLLYSSNYSVYPITRLNGPRSRLPQKNPKECPGIEPGTSVFVVCNANHQTTEAVGPKFYYRKLSSKNQSAALTDFIDIFI
jgi:hypothetical protein